MEKKQLQKIGDGTTRCKHVEDSIILKHIT